jgi:transposase-like protein
MSKDKIIELSEQGKIVTDIAKELNVSKPHVSQTLKRYRESHPSQEPESPPSSPPEPKPEVQVRGPTIAASEEKEPEALKPKIRREPAPEVLEYTKEKLKAITMEELADDPKKWEDYLRQLPNVWGGTRKGGSGWSTGMLAAFDILAVALNKRAKKHNQ